MTAPPSAFPCCMGLGYVMLNGAPSQCPNCPNGVRWANASRGAPESPGTVVMVEAPPIKQQIEVRDPRVRDLALALDGLLRAIDVAGVAESLPGEAWEQATSVLADVPAWALPPRDASPVR